jgi:hypothetical protein
VNDITQLELFRLMARDAARHVVHIIIWFVAMTALGMAIDLAQDEQAALLLLLIFSCVTTVAQYSVVRVTVADLAPPGHNLAPFARFFLLSLLTQLGLWLGFVALIIPGILLMVRWSMAVPTLIAGNFTVGEAVRFSWHATADHFRPILIVFAAIWLPALGLVGATIWYDGEIISVLGATVYNVALSGALIASWLATAAIFRADLQRADPSQSFGAAPALG